MKNKVLILGAGPCGLSLGYYLANRFNILILEKNNYVGGISASKKYKNMSYDLGSHRFLPSFKGNALDFLKKFAGKNLQKNERKGLIRLNDKWLKYPLKITDAYRISFVKSIKWISSSLIYKIIFLFKGYDKTSHQAFLKSFGKAFTDDFYKPFFIKVFGQNLKNLSDEQFKRRVSAVSLINIIKKSLSNLYNQSLNFYYYTPNGIGEIYNIIEKKKLNKNIRKSAIISKIDIKNKEVSYVINGKKHQYKYDQLVSTIPLNELVNLTTPPPPKQIINSSKKLLYRSIVLPYFVIKGKNKFDSETFYFPEEKFIFNRLYFPNSYYKNSKTNQDLYLLGLEVTCQYNDVLWQMSKEKLKIKILKNLKKLNLFDESDIIDFFIEKEKYAYPIYLKDYKKHLENIKNYYYSKNILLNGRQGLFLHNNQHHSIEMAYYASKALNFKNKSCEHWRSIEKNFDEYKVTD
jgi:protoporphyrinogen oxidase